MAFRIAVLSDTHMSTPSSSLHRVFENHLKHLDAVLHCGDITGEQVWSFLNSHDSFVAVAGNMDGSWSSVLPGQTTVRIQGLKIGLLHGHGVGFGGLTSKVREVFEPDVDLICFGHTHLRAWKLESDGTCLLNPGSFSLPKKSPPGYAVVHVNGDKDLRPEWVDL